MIKGVNLGNWLVLEKWMSPDLFARTEAEDETQLCSDLDDVARRERLTVHRDSYVTERDFAYLGTAASTRSGFRCRSSSSGAIRPTSAASSTPGDLSPSRPAS